MEFGLFYDISGSGIIKLEMESLLSILIYSDILIFEPCAHCYARFKT